MKWKVCYLHNQLTGLYRSSTLQVSHLQEALEERKGAFGSLAAKYVCFLV